jgi:hypothetical protein
MLDEMLHFVRREKTREIISNGMSFKIFEADVQIYGLFVVIPCAHVLEVLAPTILRVEVCRTRKKYF